MGKWLTVNNNIEAKEPVTKKESGGINTNVVLTDFETNTVLTKLSTEENILTKANVYGMVKYVKKITDEDTWEITEQKMKFLSMNGRFKNGAWVLLNVTVVVTDNSRFYVTLSRQDLDKDLFVNHIWHMQMILANMQGSFMNDEQIDEEAEAINSFGSTK